MSRINLFVEKRGIRKNSPKSVDNVQDATLRLYPDGMQTLSCHEISIDARHRDGTPREKELIFIRFADHQQWSGTFADLQHALKVAKGMKDLEESSPIVAQPALKHTNQTVTLTDERRLDMLTGALEGGSNYWYEIKETADSIIRECTPEMQGRPFVDRMFMAIKQGRAIQVHDCETDELLGEITMQAMEEGEKLMQAKHPEHFADILSENDDATTADVWFQMVVLKDLVYG